MTNVYCIYSADIIFLKLSQLQYFDLFFKSSGPQIAIFSRFKEQWKFIDTTKFRTIDAPAIGVKSELTGDESGWLNEKRKDIIGFLQNQLSQDNQPHQHYLLALVLLGANDAVVSDDGFIHFSPPGAYHRARWMAKEINCIKIYLFSDFNNALTHDEVHRQLIFQIVKYNRHLMTTLLKKNYGAD